MVARAPTVASSAAGSGSAPAGTLPGRNRRTALVLVAWILVLALASILVAWFRN